MGFTALNYKNGCNKYCGKKIDKNEALIILCGLVKPSSIDWQRSTGLKINYSEENELTVFQNEPIEIYKIIYYDEKGNEKYINFNNHFIMKA